MPPTSKMTKPLPERSLPVTVEHTIGTVHMGTGNAHPLVVALAFGPVIGDSWGYEGLEATGRDSESFAAAFADWLSVDPRTFTTEELVKRFNEFVTDVTRNGID